VTAAYSGDAAFNQSTSPPIDQVVRGYATTTTVLSSVNPSRVGQPVVFSATVGSDGGGTPTGTVQFAVDGADVGVSRLDAAVENADADSRSGRPSPRPVASDALRPCGLEPDPFDRIGRQAPGRELFGWFLGGCVFGHAVDYLASGAYKRKRADIDVRPSDFFRVKGDRPTRYRARESLRPVVAVSAETGGSAIPRPSARQRGRLAFGRTCRAFRLALTRRANGIVGPCRCGFD